LNRRLQARLNGGKHDHIDTAFGRIGVGDRVIQTRNSPDYGIFNGDTGYVLSVDHDSKYLIVDFSGNKVAIAFADCNELNLAYALTIHKSQGSEAPVVIVPLVTQHWAMLQRNLFYTAITRARKLAIVVGQNRAIETAATRIGGNVRITALCRLMGPDPVVHETIQTGAFANDNEDEYDE